MFGAKHVAAGYKHVHASFDEPPSCVVVYATIYFDEGVAARFLDQFFETAHFVDGVFDELLSAKAWVDRHEKHHVHVLDDVVEHADRSVGIECDASLHACGVNLLDSAVQVWAGFIMHVHHVGSQGFDLFGELARIDNHQVYVKRLFAYLRNGLQHGESETDVGHEDAVHHVEVEPVGLTAVNHVDVLGQVGKVCRK